MLGFSPAAAQSAAPTPVPTATVQPATWRTHVEVSADLQARQNATLSPALGGVVTQVLFTSGQQVTAGQVLVQLDNGPATAQLNLDAARLSQAQRDYARTQKLMAIAGSSQSALEQAAAQAAEARAQVALDQANLAQLQIAAPFAGTAGIRKIDPGDYLSAGQPVVTLTANGPLRVLFAIPQTEAGGLAPGDGFTLHTPMGAGGDIYAPGVVTALSPQVDEATNARDVEGRLAGDAPGLLAGMAGVVDIATGAPQPAFSVPSTALNDSTLGPFVFVLTPGAKADTLSTVYVTIYGVAGGNTLISTAGLNAGERIVALGGFKLTDGASVVPQSP
jgi:RND family efflux transporter MFP subunit